MDIYPLLPPCHDCDILPSDSSMRTELFETAGDPCTEPRLPGCRRCCGELGCVHTWNRQPHLHGGGIGTTEGMGRHPRRAMFVSGLQDGAAHTVSMEDPPQGVQSPQARRSPMCPHASESPGRGVQGRRWVRASLTGLVHHCPDAS